VGNHKAATQQLIDTDIKKFKYMSDAIMFAIECTECANYSELLQKAGVSESMANSELNEELLINKKEFIRYKE
tara:strand:- start:7218 stop:7436 length:219 start_codon:yes stop_codon:yes gene_type:complete